MSPDRRGAQLCVRPAVTAWWVPVGASVSPRELSAQDTNSPDLLTEHALADTTFRAIRPSLAYAPGEPTVGVG